MKIVRAIRSNYYIDFKTLYSIPSENLYLLKVTISDIVSRCFLSTMFQVIIKVTFYENDFLFECLYL